MKKKGPPLLPSFPGVRFDAASASRTQYQSVPPVRPLIRSPIGAKVTCRCHGRSNMVSSQTCYRKDGRKGRRLGPWIPIATLHQGASNTRPLAGLAVLFRPRPGPGGPAKEPPEGLSCTFGLAASIHSSCCELRSNHRPQALVTACSLANTDCLRARLGSHLPDMPHLFSTVLSRDLVVSFLTVSCPRSAAAQNDAFAPAPPPPPSHPGRIQGPVRGERGSNERCLLFRRLVPSCRPWSWFCLSPFCGIII
ncbi:hypothetical protein GQ53DRAFT_362956 [Thozetella sp. PMI_491]|nr:hypothetical protein GQ53DRAFT_362956 [Thozetella sp. PMI_491]